MFGNNSFRIIYFSIIFCHVSAKHYDLTCFNLTLLANSNCMLYIIFILKGQQNNHHGPYGMSSSGVVNKRRGKLPNKYFRW